MSFPSPRSLVASLGLPVLAALGAAAAPASAESVRFDEFPAYDDPAVVVSDEYAHLGLQFLTAGTIWSGVSEGDAGGWGLEGSDGPSFLGIDAPVFNFVMNFAWPVSEVSFQVARSDGGGDMTLLVAGYRANLLSEITMVPLLPDSSGWVTAELGQELDQVVVLGLGDVPFAVDGLRWSGPLGDPVEQAREVAIDIRPGSDRNPIRIGSRARGVVPVALFGADDFDVASVDPGSLVFGPAGARPIHRGGPHMEDVDGDGLLDLVAHFDLAEIGLGADALEACLEGTSGEVPFAGCDGVTPMAR